MANVKPHPILFLCTLDMIKKNALKLKPIEFGQNVTDFFLDCALITDIIYLPSASYSDPLSSSSTSSSSHYSSSVSSSATPPSSVSESSSAYSSSSSPATPPSSSAYSPLSLSYLSIFHLYPSASPPPAPPLPSHHHLTTILSSLL